MDTREGLKNQIWTTRISRINAESRLIQKSAFIEGINIYYSCVIVVFSILLLMNQSAILSLLTLVMSIVLIITILYCKGLRYEERAKNYHVNYTSLQRLEFRLSHDISNSELSEIQDSYCSLLNGAENHITFDYYKAVANSTGPYRKSRYSCKVAISFWYGIIWRFLLKVALIIFPLVLVFLTYKEGG